MLKKDSLLKSLILIKYSLVKFIKDTLVRYPDAIKTEASGALETGMSYNLFVSHIRSNNFEQLKNIRIFNFNWNNFQSNSPQYFVFSFDNI